MTETILDVKGLTCPLPVLKANKALRGMAAGARPGREPECIKLRQRIARTMRGGSPCAVRRKGKRVATELITGGRPRRTASRAVARHHGR